MQDKKALNEIVSSEVEKTIMESIEKIELIHYTEIFFNRNYSHIKEIYTNDEYKDDNKKLFLRVKFNIEQIIKLTQPNYGGLTVDPHLDIKRLGIISEWVYLVGADAPGRGFTAVINPTGQKIVEEWNKYKTKI